MRSHTRIEMWLSSHNDISANGIELLPESKDQNKQFAVGPFCPMGLLQRETLIKRQGRALTKLKIRVQEMIWVNYTTLSEAWHLKETHQFSQQKQPTTLDSSLVWSIVHHTQTGRQLGDVAFLPASSEFLLRLEKVPKVLMLGEFDYVSYLSLRFGSGVPLKKKVVFLARYSFLHLDVLTSFKRRIN